jgi:UDP-N-acetylmuramyl tripeptide synthase
MQRFIGTAIGKSVKQVTRLRKGSGQALPGLIVERLFPAYFAKMLAQLPGGVVVITGTNGKTTTTKMVVELLRANGKKVLTNPTGSNLTRGINSMLISQSSSRGKLDFDIAVLELDEAYARLFAKQVPVRWVLALNVTRDQLDRFGEVDTAASMIIDTMQQAREGIVVNADDPRLFPAGQKIQKQKQIKLNMFSVSESLRKFFPTENELVAVATGPKVATGVVNKDVVLTNFSGQTVTYTIDQQDYTAELNLSGQHNFQNAAAALSLAKVLLPAIAAKELIEQLAHIKPAFGRGEVFQLRNGSSLRLVLVKNPAGFRQALASYLPTNAPVMIAINDNIADGRDVSWLWDVDFAELRHTDIFCTSGKRAADMALRLQYDEIHVDTVEPDLAKALSDYCDQPGNKLLFTTYTAMLWLHKTLVDKAGRVL